MTISASTKIDLLWKKVGYGVTETTTNKQAYEENIASPYAILNTQVWQQADQIPVPASTLANVVQFVTATLTPDQSVTSKQAWLTYQTSGTSLVRLHDFIPFTVDSGYSANVYSDSSLTTALLPGVDNYEWVFDYSAGVLYFPNSIPSSVGGTLYLTGYRYVGPKGVGSGSAATSSNAGLYYNTLSYTTGSLLPGVYIDFTLSTSAVFFINQVSISSDATVNCFSTSNRTDNNPYTFVAQSSWTNLLTGTTASWLVDDGSFAANGIRYPGVGNMLFTVIDNPGSGNSYWRITNSTATFVSSYTMQCIFLTFTNLS
jgi:hypothetical protein